MLERAVFQQFILDNLGNIQPNAQVTVRNASDDSIADIYESLTAIPTKSNPFNVGSSALARFYAAPGRYNIRFWKDGKEATLENVDISSKSHRLDLNKSTGAELVAYDPTTSGLNVFDVQSAIDRISQLNGNIVGYVEAFKTENNTWEDAIVECCNKAVYAVFPKGQTVNINELSIPETAICRGWFLQGAKLSVSNSKITFDNQMDFLDLQGGTIAGGLKLAKVAVATGKDQISVTVYQGHGIEVGDYVTSSLDNLYLPNSTSRVGYQEEGDFNRVVSVVDNGDGTDTINLTYRFFRSEDSNVYSGWIQNAWISGNASFNNLGIEFSKGGDVEVRNGVVEYYQGYFFSIDDGPTNLTSTLTLKNLNINYSFIDIVRFRGYGIISDRLKVSRQYDFSKQLFVVEQPTNGFIKIINGCRFERKNRDAEIFATPFDSDGEANSGLIWTDGTNYFDGTQPSDLPTSDFTKPIQNENLYWGRLVAISDCLHWFVPNANGNHGGIVSNGDKFVGYMRSIYGTSFAQKDVFTWEICQFNGSETSCSPFFNQVTGAANKPILRCELNGGKYKTYATNGFNSGGRTVATDAHIIVDDSAIDSPFIEGAATLNSIQMWGGMIEGRYSISGNLSDFNRVQLPYRGTNREQYNPLISSAVIGDLNSINFLLNTPRGIDFENTGQGIEQWYDSLPTNAWFITNVSPDGASPPALRFEVQSVNAIYEVGSEEGFSHLYQATLFTVGIDKPIIETRGKWSGILKPGDFIYLSLAKEYLEVSGSQQTTTSSAGDANADPVQTSFTVTDAPTGNPAWVGVYDTIIQGWIYYAVSSVSGSTVNIAGSVTRDFPTGSDVTLVYLKDDVKSIDYAHYKGGFDSVGALVPTVNENITGLLSATGGNFLLQFESPIYVDNYNAHVFNPSNLNEQYVVVCRTSVNDTTRSDFRFLIFKNTPAGSLTQIQNGGELNGCVFEFYAQEASYR